MNSPDPVAADVAQPAAAAPAPTVPEALNGLQTELNKLAEGFAVAKIDIGKAISFITLHLVWIAAAAGLAVGFFLGHKLH